MELIKQIAQDVKAIGGDLFIVGGYVRDMHLGRKSKDIDCEVYRITPEQLRAVLSKYGKVKECGDFTTYKLIVKDAELPYEFSFPRTERKIGVGHNKKAFTVDINPNLSYKEASRRRDLTINALMLCPLTGLVIDEHNGLNDLAQGVIRHIDDRTFAEDPLRVLRVAQFSARFDFEVDSRTEKLCKSLLVEMKYLSRERFYIELEKMLMKAEKPSIAFRWMLDAGILCEIFPEIAMLRGVNQGKKHHPEGDVFEHTMIALDSVPMEQRTITRMLAILLHDIGKAVVPTSEEENGDVVHFYGHAEDGEPVVREFLARLTKGAKGEAELKESVVALTVYHMHPYQMQKSINKKNLRRLAMKVDIDDLMAVNLADMSGKPQDTSHVDKILVLWREIQAEPKPVVTGDTLIALGLKPSPEFGKLKKIALDAQLDKLFTTEAEGIEWMLDNKHVSESFMHRVVRKIKSLWRGLRK